MKKVLLLLAVMYCGMGAAGDNPPTIRSEHRVSKGIADGLAKKRYATTDVVTFSVDGVVYEITSEGENENTVRCGDNSSYGGNRDLVIPASVSNGNKEYLVTEFVEGAFFANKTLTSVTIPNTIKTLEKNVFASCENLKSVKLPNTITAIGNSAFTGCKSLESIVIPQSVTEIVVHAFSHCESMEYVICEGETPPVLNGIEVFYRCNARILVSQTSLQAYKKSWAEYADRIFPVEVANIGKKMALGTLGEKREGPAVEVTGQDGKVVRLYNPKKVEFIKESGN